MLNDRVLPFYMDEALPVLRILTDRGTEYCGKAETHDYQLYLVINEIEHKGKRCDGRTPMVTLLDGKRIWQEKLIN